MNLPFKMPWYVALSFWVLWLLLCFEIYSAVHK